MKIVLSDVKHYYAGVGHGLNHVIRVYMNALRIAKTIDCDIEVVKAAALLHDIARPEDEFKIGRCHAEKGAKMASEILKKYDYTEEQKKNIIHAIRVHRFSKRLKPRIIEAEILQDADRLDALGAVVITRIIHHGAKAGRPTHDPSIPPNKEYNGVAGSKTSINHFYEKILKIKPETFHTEKGKELARGRYKFTKQFIEQFLKEWNCKI